MTSVPTLSVTTLFTSPTFEGSQMTAKFEDLSEAISYVRKKPDGKRENVRGLFVSDKFIYFDHGVSKGKTAIKFFSRTPNMTDVFWQKAIEATQLNTTYFAQDEEWT